MNWLDRVIDRHGDVILILATAIALAAFLGATWASFHWGR